MAKRLDGVLRSDSRRARWAMTSTDLPDGETYVIPKSPLVPLETPALAGTVVTFQPHTRSRSIPRWHVIRFTIGVRSPSRSPICGGTVALTSLDSLTDLDRPDDLARRRGLPGHRSRPVLPRRHHRSGDRADRERPRPSADSARPRQPCLEFALTTNQDSGVWGGTSEEERRKLRRQWRRSPSAARQLTTPRSAALRRPPPSGGRSRPGRSPGRPVTVRRAPTGRTTVPGRSPSPRRAERRSCRRARW